MKKHLTKRRKENKEIMVTNHEGINKSCHSKIQSIASHGPQNFYHYFLSIDNTRGMKGKEFPAKKTFKRGIQVD